MNGGIADERLRRQLLSLSRLGQPADVVAWLGAVQAQEYEAAKWALALRMRDGAVTADIEKAFDDGEILRTHVLRPTWHFVTPTDVRWMQELTSSGVHRRMATYDRQLGLDAATMKRAGRVIERAFRDRRFLTRAELGEQLQRAGLPLDSIRLAHIVMHAELQCIIVSGPRRGKQFTYALLEERAPRAASLPRDEALATLAARFFRSHGPATSRDFSWWSGLSAADARRSLEIIKAKQVDVDGRTYWTTGQLPRSNRRDVRAHLLPIYDEYLVSYRDREAVPHGPRMAAAGPRFVTFDYALLIAGQVAGTWRRSLASPGLRVDVTVYRRVNSIERRAIAGAVDRYEAFVSTPVEFSID